MEADDADEQNEIMLLMNRWAESVNSARLQLVRAAAAGGIDAVASTAALSSAESGSWGGRLPGVRNVQRGTSSWLVDYLGDAPVYSLRSFRRRFRIPRVMFRKLFGDLLQHNPGVWGRKTDCCGHRGIDPEVKVLACLRYLGTGRAMDDIDDSSRMSAESVRVYLRHFVEDIEELYGSQYLNRRPTRVELQTIAERYEEADFPGCVGCVDCMNLKWKNCPYEEKGQYHNTKEGKLAIIKVEAWCDIDLYVWHWWAGKAGTSNDKTMVAYSPLFQDLFNGMYSIALSNPFRVTPDGPLRALGFFLVDGIYPRWAIFLQPVHSADNPREGRYTKRQEGRRKDIERAFGVLQARFKVLRHEDYRWNKEEIVNTSNVCVILHNMLVRMNQNGVFIDDIAEEEAGFNLVEEMWIEEQEQADARAEEVANDEGAAQAGDRTPMDYLILENMLTSREGHESLKSEFMDRFEAGGASDDE